MDAGRPSSVARQSDAVGIPAEGRNVLLEPVQRRYDVHEAVIGRQLRVAVRVGVQEACK